MLAEDMPVIYSYTRAQAIEDGVLVDVSEMGREAGIRYPVAITSTVWNGYIVPDPRGRRNGQSEAGRLWDTLWLLRCHAQRARGRQFYFQVWYIMKAKLHRQVTLKAVCGPDDNGEPVITIMLPEED